MPGMAPGSSLWEMPWKEEVISETKLQNGQVYCEVKAESKYVEQETGTLFQESASDEEFLSKEKQERTKEYYHDDGGGDHIVIENTHPARELHILESLALFLSRITNFGSKPFGELNGKHLLMGDTETAAVTHFLTDING